MNPMPFAGLHLNAGFVALVANSIVFVAVSLLTANVKADQSGSAIMKNSYLRMTGSSPDLCPGYYFLFLAGIQLTLENKV
ncbi:hypothetical protein [Sporomusa sp. KB1]|jgi:hypothetical protein|uniref:hypothetical protein n=1 Tax=Sporomusa sp. KB1 TaxID=943346 RepID=UPI0011ADDDD1|nr:hypothetical protein [Sporomusa sp. KB1]TWH49394.1 hypothetical protein Salpa_5618 [Sporomusa sp. KB1]